MPNYDAHRFVNAIRILHSIDTPELEREGVPSNIAARFVANPHAILMRMGDEYVAKVFDIIEKRQPRID